MRPPTRGSMVTWIVRWPSAVFARVWLASGHQELISSVKMRNASRAERRTSTVFTTGDNSTTLIVTLRKGFETIERIAPEAVDPFAQFGERGGVNSIEAGSAPGLIAHQARLLQRLEVLRHGR